MAIDVFEVTAPLPTSQEQPGIDLDRLGVELDNLTRHCLYASDPSLNLVDSRYANLADQLGYPLTPTIEMPFRRDKKGSDFSVYAPNSGRTHDAEDHVSGLTGLIAGAKNLGIDAKAQLVKRVVYAASTSWYESEEEFGEPYKVASRSMSVHHARQTAIDQLDGMLAMIEYRRHMMQAPPAGQVYEITALKDELAEAWRPTTGRTVAVLGAAMTGAAVLVAAKRRRK